MKHSITINGKSYFRTVYKMGDKKVIKTPPDCGDSKYLEVVMGIIGNCVTPTYILKEVL